jgi:hypothetical protein
MIGCGTNGCAPMSPAQGGPDSTNAAELGRLLGPRCCRGFPMYIGVEDQQDVRDDLSQDGHDAEDWDLGTGEIDPVGCVNSVTGDLQGKSMLARRLARAALCGPFIRTPRRDCDRGMTRTARESSERPGFSSRASGGLVRRSGKAATQDLTLWLRVNHVQPVGLRAAAESASAFARPVAARVPGILGRYALQRHALDTRAGPRSGLVTHPPRARIPCKGAAAEFTHPTRSERPRLRANRADHLEAHLFHLTDAKATTAKYPAWAAAIRSGRPTPSARQRRCGNRARRPSGRGRLESGSRAAPAPDAHADGDHEVKPDGRCRDIDPA